jgi:hypothetical protein
MDPLDKFNALGLGADGKEWTHEAPRPQNLYEGSSDEEFEVIMTDRVQSNQGGGGGKKNGGVLFWHSRFETRCLR